MTKPSVLTPAPPLCLHEPLIRQGLEAAERLLSDSIAICHSGHLWCERPCERPCAVCDCLRLKAALELLRRPRAPYADGCVAPRAIEMRATIDGLVAELVGMKHALRERAAGLKAALERLRREEQA